MNNILIRDEMNNCPMYEVLDTSEIMDSHINFRPGQKLPVQQLGTEINPIAPANNVDVQSERIIATLKAFTEEYMGSNDQLFRNATNSGGGKSATEIQAGMQSNAAPMQLSVVSWHITLSKVYQKFFEILKDRMVEPTIIDGEEITPDDLDIPATIYSNGSIELSEREFSVQKSMNRLLMVERWMQIGVATLEDYYNAALEWLERDGVREAYQFTTAPEEIAQQKIVQMQGQIQQMAQMLQKGGEEVDKLQKAIARNQVKMKKDMNQFEGKVVGKIESKPDGEMSYTEKRVNKQ
jgi:hypothetical protein